MRNILFFAAITLIAQTALHAQQTATWKGGKPGLATDWNCSANWSGGRVPDAFTQVIIPAGRQFYPVIGRHQVRIDALLVESGGMLAIQKGAMLVILGETGYFDGLTVLGQIRNNGILEIGEAVQGGTAFLSRVQGNGAVIGLTAGADALTKRR